MPFVTAGDPDLEFTAAVLAELVAPRQQPVRAGHSLQRPDRRRAGDSGFVHAGLGQQDQAGRDPRDARRASRRKSPAPVVTMVSYAIVHRHGLEQYVADAQAAGRRRRDRARPAGGRSRPSSAEICRAADFSLIQLVTPTTPRERALRIAESSTGFLYYVSVTGITGERTELPQSWSTTSAGCASKRRCRSASASASASRSTSSSWRRWPTA